MTQAIFLSYASQDADAARRICDALRAAGLEVWFDQSELRGGDAWDQSIRKQIKECALFVPVISANTDARPEGYFRLEWKLAVDRSHLMADDLAFIFPVTIGDVVESAARVPDKFRERQWTNLSHDAAFGGFAAHVSKVLEGRGLQANDATNAPPPIKEFAAPGLAKVPTKATATNRTGLRWAAIGVLVLGASAALWLVLNKLAGPAESAGLAGSERMGNPAARAVATINPLSVMVMPFANQTGDKEKAYIADALTSSITSDLSRIRDASIVPTATAFSMRDKQLTVPQLGKEAAVRFVLTGGVMADRGKLRINAVLSDTQTGAQLWAENFDGQATELFALQDRVTARIGNTIGNRMVITAARESEKRSSTPQAADLLMRARALWINQPALQNHRAIEALYRQVLRLEPDNMPAKVGLASTLSLQAASFATQMKLEPAERLALFKSAFDLAQEAKAKDPNDPDVYLPIQLYYQYIDDLDAAMQAAVRRVELSPQSFFAHASLCSLQRALDDMRGARAACVKSVELAALGRPPTEAFQHLAMIAFREEKYEEAVDWAKKASDSNPGSHVPPMAMALAYARMGDLTKAKQHAAEAVRIHPGLRLDNQWAFPNSKPWPGKDAEFKKFMETRVVAAWRAAGLPE